MVYISEARDFSNLLDLFIPAILLSLSLVSSSLVFITYYKFKSLRINSGKIVIQILIGELVLIFTYFFSFFYTFDEETNLNKKLVGKYPL